MVEMVGYEKKQLLSMTLFDLHASEDKENLRDLMREVEAKQRIQREALFRRADGSLIHVDIRKSVIDRKEGTVQSVIRDINQRKQAETELKNRMEEVTEANRRLEILVSNTTDREKRMVTLKNEVNQLLTVLGREPKYEAPVRVAEMIDAPRAHEDREQDAEREPEGAAAIPAGRTDRKEDGRNEPERGLR
jgi:PAS domain S-box-containing protein